MEKVSHKNKKFKKMERQSKKEAGEEKEEEEEEKEEKEEEKDPDKRDREFFRQVPKSLILRLYKIYQVDFEIFGYELDKDVFYNVGIDA